MQAQQAQQSPAPTGAPFPEGARVRYIGEAIRSGDAVLSTGTVGRVIQAIDGWSVIAFDGGVERSVRRHAVGGLYEAVEETGPEPLHRDLMGHLLADIRRRGIDAVLVDVAAAYDATKGTPAHDIAVEPILPATVALKDVLDARDAAVEVMLRSTRAPTLNAGQRLKRLAPLCADNAADWMREACGAETTCRVVGDLRGAAIAAATTELVTRLGALMGALLGPKGGA